MNKHELADLQAWEHAHGWGPRPRTLQESQDSLTLPDGTQVALKGGRILIKRTEAAERALQESVDAATRELHEQQPTSYVKTPEPVHGPPPLTSTGLDLTPYTKYKGTSTVKPPAPVASERPAVKTLSEAQLDAARGQLYAALHGGTVTPLPDNIHQRLFRAVRG